MACLKTLARFACVDCTMDRCEFWKMGMKNDMVAWIKVAHKDSTAFHCTIKMVCRWIFESGASPDGTNIKRTRLGLFSMLPTWVSVSSPWVSVKSKASISQSAFSECFAAFGHNVYELFVPNLMHEFELRVWKGTFTHLIHVLITAGWDGCQKLDEQ